jgi:ABC-type transport system substrate-binding protein
MRNRNARLTGFHAGLFGCAAFLSAAVGNEASEQIVITVPAAFSALPTLAARGHESPDYAEPGGGTYPGKLIVLTR